MGRGGILRPRSKFNMKQEILDQLKQILDKLDLPSDLATVERQALDKFGDYSTNIAFVLASKTKQSPQLIANKIEANFPKNNNIAKVVVVGGFINFYLSESFFATQILKLTSSNKVTYPLWGKALLARVEFISANPTGPLHIGNARGGPIGETTSRVLEKVGFNVVRDYYHNDIGTQVERLGDSVWYWYQKKYGGTEEFPKDGYQGDYVSDIAEAVIKTWGNSLIKRCQEATAKFAKFAVDMVHAQTLTTAKALGIHYNVVTCESDLLNSGRTAKVLDYLKRNNFTKEQDSAVWFAPKDEFLEDLECVLVRSDSRPTYFANDIAYHQLKFESTPDIVIDVLGSNHHGHVPRLQAAISALGYESAKFKVLLYQYVRVRKGDTFVKMAKRAGDFVAADEVLKEVGKDAFNFFMLHNSISTHMDFDLNLAKERSTNNPVYYVQYAHARSANILAKLERTQELNLDMDTLTTAEEISLIRKITSLPELVDEVSHNFELHSLAHYAVSLADSFHRFYEKSPVILPDKSVHPSRALLVKAANIALKEILLLLNISAPARM